MPDSCSENRILVEQLEKRLEQRWTDHWREHDLLSKDVERTRHEFDRRLNEGNQFREQINSERNTFLGKDEYGRRHQDLEDKIGESEEAAVTALKAYIDICDKRLNVLEAARANLEGRIWMVAAIGGLVVGVAEILQLYLHLPK